MKFTINASEFRDALKAACEVAPSKGILPEQSCVFLVADNDALRVYAKNESMDIALSVPCINVLDQGRALIPSRLLLDYISLASGEVLISTDAKQKMTIKSGNKNSSIIGMDPERYKVPAFDGKHILSAAGADLAACLNRTSFCTSTDETRSQICGVHLSVELDGKVIFVGMNGFEVSMCDMVKTDLPDDLSENYEITLPNAVLRLISSLFSGEEKVSMSLENYRACVSCPGKKLIFPLISKEYINYRRLLSSHVYKTEALVDSRAMLEALRLVEIASANAVGNDQRKNLICMQLNGQNSSISLLADNDATKAMTVVDCDLRGEDMTIYFNVKYVKELVAACAKECGNTVIRLTGPVSIACICPQDSGSNMATYVVPVRTQH